MLDIKMRLKIHICNRYKLVARNTTFTKLTIKLFYSKIKREPKKHCELEKANLNE